MQQIVKPFSLLVKPASADCNLRCAYCFYLSRLSLYPQTRKHRMTDNILVQMIRTFMATYQPEYAIGWQGGEPTLMGLDFFERVVDLQKKYGHAGAIVCNSLQTNGTLLAGDFTRHLAKYHFLVGVSLDGPAEIHDYYRKTIGGKGTHAMVIKGIDTLKQNNVDFNVLTLVNKKNVCKPLEIYRYLCDQDIFFHQYIECVEFDKNGQLMPFAISGEEWGDFLCTIYDEWIKRDTRTVSIRLFDSILNMMVDAKANVCQMGRDCRQYLVVEHNGDIYPCDFFVQRQLKLGNIMENSWADLQKSRAYEKFGKRKRLWNEKCRKCPYLLFCSGDCPKNRPFQGKDPKQLSVLCSGWKQFFKHALPGFKNMADKIRQERTNASAQSRL